MVDQINQAQRFFWKINDLFFTQSDSGNGLFGNGHLYYYPLLHITQKITSYIYRHKIIAMAYNLLKGKRGIITGALDANSIAWKVAEKAYEEGATFVLTNAPIAMRMGEINKLAEQTGSQIIPADATNVDELTNLFTQSQEILGGKIDFVLHSIGMSVNIRKKIPYTELNYDYFNKGIDVSAMSFHKMLAVARKLDAINEWGSVV